MTEEPEKNTADSASADAGAEQQPAGEQPKKSKVPLGNVVFGPRGWLAVLLPYLVMLGGLQIAAYIESARAHTSIKVVSDEVKSVLLAVSNHIQQDTELLDRLEINYGWKNFVGDLSLIGMGEHYDLEEVQENAERALSAFERENLPGKQQIDEAVSFMFKLIDYEKQHHTRPIIEESFQRRQRQLEAAGEPVVTTTSRWFPPARPWYPTTYSLTILLTAIITLLALPRLLRDPFRISPLAVGVGVVGIVVWLALWWLDTRLLGLGHWLMKGGREAFNPFEELKDDPTWMYTFLGIRIFGLVLLVPVVEEFFLRGWLMRFIDHPDWDQVPLGYISKLSFAGVIIYAVASHMAEPLAAVAWFLLITWLYVRTKSIWDCVVAHAVTNLLLGVFVLATKTWELW